MRVLLWKANDKGYSRSVAQLGRARDFDVGAIGSNGAGTVYYRRRAFPVAGPYIRRNSGFEYNNRATGHSNRACQPRL